MIEDVKLIVADIDGTLTSDKHGLPEEVKKAIEKLHSHGVLFGIASGRSVDQQLMAQAKKWGFDFEFDIVIGMNGSELYDGIHHERHDYYKLKREWIKEIVEMLEPFDLNPFMYYGNTMLALKMDKDIEASSERNRTPVLVAENPEQFWAKENAKIMYRIPLEKMPEVEAYVNAHPSPYYKSFKTQTTMLEFTDSRVSKAVALKVFCESNQIPLSSVMTFGDMSNDNEMLEISGWGVCLLNGEAKTKALADDITEKTNNESGFADYIEKHIFIPRGW